MRYRPHIDGLRAIAIILVLIYHGGLSYFPSGFIGVDVFFVISGFLITSIIHESLNKKQFSFRYTSITLTAYLVFIYRMAMLSDFALSNVWFASLVSQKTADNGCVSAYFNLFFIDLILIIHLSSHFITAYNGFPQRFNEELVTVYQQLDKYASPQRPSCISDNSSGVNLQCTMGSKKQNTKKALMIGDSFANHYWGLMDTFGQDAGVSILAQGVSSCITLPGIYLYDWWYFKNKIYQECFDQTQKYYSMIQHNHYDYVIIGQIWSNYLSDKVITKLDDVRSLSLAKKRIETALDNALKTIIASGAKPVLIKTTALMQENFHDCFFKHIKLRQTYDPKQCSFNLTVSDSEQWFGNLFHKMKNKYPQLIVIDPKKVQCEQGRCAADVNGVPVYRDVGHITDYASYQFGKMYLKKFHNPLLSLRFFYLICSC